MLAAGAGSTEILKAMNRGPSLLDLKDADGGTAAMSAAAHSHSSVLDYVSVATTQSPVSLLAAFEIIKHNTPCMRRSLAPPPTVTRSIFLGGVSVCYLHHQKSNSAPFHSQHFLLSLSLSTHLSPSARRQTNTNTSRDRRDETKRNER